MMSAGAPYSMSGRPSQARALQGRGSQRDVRVQAGGEKQPDLVATCPVLGQSSIGTRQHRDPGVDGRSEDVGLPVRSLGEPAQARC